MNLAFLALLPAALLIDRLFGELPSRVHPVCMMGALASRIEALFPRGRAGVGRAGLRRPPGGMVRLGHHHLDLRRAPEP